MRAHPRSFVSGILLAIVLLSGVMATPGCSGVLIERPPDPEKGAPGRIFLPAGDEWDLGEARAGEVITATIILRNVGGSVLRIRGVAPPSDRISAVPAQETIPADGAIDLRVTVDTRGRVGRIRIPVVILSSDPVDPSHTIHLLAIVTDENHDAIAVKEAVVLSSPCRGCHVDRGAGLLGEALFRAVCSVCHGMDDNGGKRSHPLKELRKMPVERIRTAIVSGVPGTVMPSFRGEGQGPFTEIQVDSLIRFIGGDT